MPRKITQEEYLERCLAKHGDLYDLSLVEYTGAECIIQVICKKHGQFSINAKGFATKGHGCSKCSNELKTSKSLKPLDYYITKFREVHGDKYNYYVESGKLNTKRTVDISCTTCGNNFTQKVSAHLTGQGCLKCSSIERGLKKALPREEAESQVLAACGDRYICDFSNYTHYTTKLKVTCKKHNEVFYRDYYNLVKNKNSCPTCAREAYKDFRLIDTKEDVIEAFKKVRGELYDYSKTDYKGSEVRVIVTCAEHGDFKVKPVLHKRGQGCPKCGRFILDTETFISKAKVIHGEQFDYSSATYVDSYEKTTIRCIPCDYTYEVAPYSHLAGTGCPKCSAKMVSSPEEELKAYIESLGVTNIQTSVRGLIGRKELDLYLPEYKLAIEYNGTYWHSSRSKKTDSEFSKKHLIKTEACEELGIQLLHINENEWLDTTKKTIWKSVISNKLKKNTRVYARKCTIQEVPKVEARKFCDENHLQGNAHSSIQLGLYSEGNLLMLTTYSKSRFTDEDYELLRMCTLKGYNVIGGASKLIKAFKERAGGEVSLVSYANRRWSVGNVYSTIGFTFKHYSKPCYFYYKNNATIKELHHRSKFQKHKLSNLLDNFDESLSEVDNMYLNGYSRIWDSGNIVYTL